MKTTINILIPIVLIIPLFSCVTKSNTETETYNNSYNLGYSEGYRDGYYQSPDGYWYAPNAVYLDLNNRYYQNGNVYNNNYIPRNKLVISPKRNRVNGNTVTGMSTQTNTGTRQPNKVTIKTDEATKSGTRTNNQSTAVRPIQTQKPIIENNTQNPKGTR